MTFNLTCGKDVTDPQNLTNLRLSLFAESNQMQQKNFDVSPKTNVIYNGKRRVKYGRYWVFWRRFNALEIAAPQILVTRGEDLAVLGEGVRVMRCHNT